MSPDSSPSHGESPRRAPIVHTALRQTPLDPTAIEHRVEVSGAGGICVFRGRIRPSEQGEVITSMAYEHYAGMAEKKMSEVVDDATNRWPLLAVAVEHRVGEVAVDDDAVVVAVGAGHRAEAFEACRWVIDEVKRVVPIWKSSDAGPGQPDAVAAASAPTAAGPQEVR